MSSTDTGLSTRSSSRDSILELRDVSATFEMSRGSSGVVKDVSIDVHRDEVLGIVGESGCGKSMLASSLLDAVVDPGVTTGEIIYHPRDGEPVDILSMSDQELSRFRWEEAAMVFQGAMESFNPTMKIGDHFAETIESHMADKQERMDYAEEILKELQLDPERVLDAYPHELSGGMKQRALIALALLLEPEILIMDEPTSALDMLMQRTIINLIATLQEDLDLTLVFITHDIPLASGLSDRLAVMYAFEIVEIGPIEEVMLDAAHPYTRGLLQSVPSIDAPIDELSIVEGSAPDPIDIPPGCSYHPRCPMADDRCEIEDPDLVEIEEGRRAACFYWDQVEDAIPYTIERTDQPQGGDGE